MTKLERAIKYAKAQIERLSPYIWSGQGQRLAKINLAKLAEMEDSAENASRVAAFVYKNIKRYDPKRSKCYDCSGYVCEILRYAKVFYGDLTADGIMKKFNKPISKTARRAGDLVFRTDKNGHAYHVGFLLSPDLVAEAKGRDWGVVASPWDADHWQEVRRVFD